MERGVRPHGASACGLMLAVACSSEVPASHVGGESTETTQSTGASTGDPSGEDDRLLVLPPLEACDPNADRPASVRMVTWNVSAGRISSLAEVGEVLAAIEADIVVLQELDVLVRRTGNVDQPQVLAEGLGYAYAFAASVEFDGGDFGIGVLSRLPFAAARRISLLSEGGSEPRIALDVTLCAGPQPLRVVDVHADFVPEVNTASLIALAEELGSTLAAPTIIAGDLNATEGSEGVQALIGTSEAVDVLATWDPGPTQDDERIDYVLASPTLAAAVTEAARVETEASDHLPLRVDVALP